MRPKIIMHTQISLDGCIRGFENPEVYYKVAAKIQSDAVLFGSNTVYMAFENYPAETEADFVNTAIQGDLRQIGVIPDSRGILRNLHCLRNLGYLKEIVILISETTPKEYLKYLEERQYPFIIAGNDHVDYEQAFHILREKYGCQCIRTDSGGTLTSVLFEKGLIDEISLIVSPFLIGNQEKHVFESLRLQDNIKLDLLKHEEREAGCLELKYSVTYTK